MPFPVIIPIRITMQQKHRFIPQKKQYTFLMPLCTHPPTYRVVELELLRASGAEGEESEFHLGRPRLHVDTRTYCHFNTILCFLLLLLPGTVRFHSALAGSCWQLSDALNLYFRRIHRFIHPLTRSTYSVERYNVSDVSYT